MTIVPEDLPFPADFLFAERCLEGDERAIVEFRTKYGPPVLAYLLKRGGSETDARDVTEWLWADCLSERPQHRPRLATYAGRASLKSWLCTLALNRLIALKRAQSSREQYEQGGLEIDRLQEIPSERGSSGSSEAPLINLMREAIEAGFRACSAEEFVMLQLTHLDRLHLDELKTMFKYSKSKIQRDVEEAGQLVAKATLSYIRKIDPWLELQWDDFMELSRVASPACFGLEEA